MYSTPLIPAKMIECIFVSDNDLSGPTDVSKKSGSNSLISEGMNVDWFDHSSRSSQLLCIHCTTSLTEHARTTNIPQYYLVLIIRSKHAQCLIRNWYTNFNHSVKKIDLLASIPEILLTHYFFFLVSEYSCQ